MWRIRDWKNLFENNRTRNLKSMGWVPLPNKHDGDGYTELMDHPDGTSHFGAWVGVVQVASRCDPRGTLVRDSGEPHTVSTLARMTRIPVSILESALPRLVAIGWIEETSTKQGVRPRSQEGAVSPQEGAGKPQDGAMNGREGNGRERLSVRREIMATFERWLNVPGSSSVNWGPVTTWLAGVEVDGDLDLAKRCVEHAITSPQSRPHNATGAVRYVQAIYERCRQHGCEPGEFPTEPVQADTMLDKARKNMERLAAEERAEKMAAAGGAK